MGLERCCSWFVDGNTSNHSLGGALVSTEVKSLTFVQ